MPQFFAGAMKSSTQIASSAGCFHASVLRDKDRVFWTKSMWDDESSMRAYMVSGAHGKTMHGLLDWCDEGAIAHWNQESREPPAWLGLDQVLVKDGRRSKIKHPNRAQQEFFVRPPAVEGSRIVTFR